MPRISEGISGTFEGVPGPPRRNGRPTRAGVRVGGRRAPKAVRLLDFLTFLEVVGLLAKRPERTLDWFSSAQILSAEAPTNEGLEMFLEDLDTPLMTG